MHPKYRRGRGISVYFHEVRMETSKTISTVDRGFEKEKKRYNLESKFSSRALRINKRDGMYSPPPLPSILVLTYVEPEPQDIL